MLTNLKTYRIKKDFTQKQLAEAIGLTKNAICMYEAGKRSPSISIVKRISEILCVPIDNLVGNRMYEKSSANDQNYTPQPPTSSDEEGKQNTRR